MSRKPSRKPKPDPGLHVATATKESVAVGQLESAILLWFHEADPVSVLVLASNAEDCLHALGKRVGKPAAIKGKFEKLPKSFQERATYVQDFAKHGEKDTGEPVDYVPESATMTLLSAVDAFTSLYGTATGIMRIFFARCLLEYPQLATQERQAMFIKSANVDNLGSGNRKDFFDKFSSIFGSQLFSSGEWPKSHLP